MLAPKEYNHGYTPLDTDSSYLWGFSRFHAFKQPHKTNLYNYNIQLLHKVFSNSRLVDPLL